MILAHLIMQDSRIIYYTGNDCISAFLIHNITVISNKLIGGIFRNFNCYLIVRVARVYFEKYPSI